MGELEARAVRPADRGRAGDRLALDQVAAVLERGDRLLDDLRLRLGRRGGVGTGSGAGAGLGARFGAGCGGGRGGVGGGGGDKVARWICTFGLRGPGAGSGDLTTSRAGRGAGAGPRGGAGSSRPPRSTRSTAAAARPRKAPGLRRGTSGNPRDHARGKIRGGKRCAEDGIGVDAPGRAEEAVGPHVEQDFAADGGIGFDEAQQLRGGGFVEGAFDVGGGEGLEALRVHGGPPWSRGSGRRRRARAMEDDAVPIRRSGRGPRRSRGRVGRVPVVGFDDRLRRLFEAADAVAEGVERRVVVAHALEVVLEDALEADAVAAGGFAAAEPAAALVEGEVAGDLADPGEEVGAGLVVAEACRGCGGRLPGRGRRGRPDRARARRGRGGRGPRPGRSARGRRRAGPRGRRGRPDRSRRYPLAVPMYGE